MNITDTIYVFTNWALFEVGKVSEIICIRSCGYGLGCFFHFGEETEYSSIDEATDALIEWYGKKEELD